MHVDKGAILALDVGGVRIGLALASSIARLATPLRTLENDDSFLDRLRDIIAQESVTQLVVGYPRGLSGQVTEQTKAIEEFTQRLQVLAIPIAFQDEAVTSAQAEAELQRRGKLYRKGDIDALAATYILEDYLTDHQQ